MSNYTQVTNFLSKDSLISGNPLKAVKGADLTTEFTAVQTAVNSKLDSGAISADGTGHVTVAAPTVTGAVPAVTINGNTTEPALTINSSIAAGAAVFVSGSTNQSLVVSLTNVSTGTAATSQYRLGDGTALATLELQNVNAISTITGGVNGGAINVGGTTAVPMQLVTNHIVRATIDGTTGFLTLKFPQVTGWGTPTGASVQNNFAGGAATLGTLGAAVAKIITDLKAFGLYGT